MKHSRGPFTQTTARPAPLNLVTERELGWNHHAGCHVAGTALDTVMVIVMMSGGGGHCLSGNDWPGFSTHV